MTDLQLDKLEVSLNKALRKSFFLTNDYNYEPGDIVVWDIVYSFCKDLGLDLITDRKNENILKINEFPNYQNPNVYGATRHHIYIERHEFDLGCFDCSLEWFKNNCKLTAAKNFRSYLVGNDSMELYTYTVNVVA